MGGAGVKGFDDNRYLLILNRVLEKLRAWWEAKVSGARELVSRWEPAAEEGSSGAKWKEGQGSPPSGQWALHQPLPSEGLLGSSSCVWQGLRGDREGSLVCRAFPS